MAEPTDIVMLTHNRLAHLEATLDALEARTRAPYRLTIVDNASGPEVRNWLAANRHRFHGLILRPTNEFLSALNHGIAATQSDPFMVTDPDLIVPDLEPCWLTRMRDTFDRHPNYGLLGIGLDQSNLPSVQEPEVIDPSEIVDGEIVARPVGSVFTLIRRDALHAPYVTDWETARASSVRATGTGGRSACAPTTLVGTTSGSIPRTSPRSSSMASIARSISSSAPRPWLSSHWPAR